MGKHNKRTRNEYLKRRRKRLKRRREEKVSEEVNKDGEISSSTDHDSCVEQDSSESEAGSDILQGYKDDEISTSTDHDSCVGQDSSESEAGSDIFQGCYLDPHDQEVVRRYSYPPPKHDPLLLGFYRFQENKRKLLHLLRNPLGNQWFG